MTKMVSCLYQRTIGEADVYSVLLTDQTTVRVVVSNAQKLVNGEDRALRYAVAKRIYWHDRAKELRTEAA